MALLLLSAKGYRKLVINLFISNDSLVFLPNLKYRPSLIYPKIEAPESAEYTTIYKFFFDSI